MRIKSVQSTLLMLLLVWAGTLQAQNQVVASRAYVLFVYSFIKYVQWPPFEGDHFTIGVYGPTKAYSELLLLAESKKAGEMPIVVTKVETIEQLGQVQLLYVGRDQPLDPILAQARNLPLLVVCEQAGMVERGAAISFVTIGENSIRFEINKAVLEERRLKIAKNLESLAFKKS